jgi:hypothetical protein
MKHTFKMLKYLGTFSTVIVCVKCLNPEPDTVAYIWTDSDGTVYFDGNTIEELFLFLAHHDAFKLTEIPEASNG